MIKKTEKLVITFHTATEAMAMEHFCKKRNADGRIIPVPGNISADCGLAWCAGLQSEESLLTLMNDYRLRFQGLYHCLV